MSIEAGTGLPTAAAPGVYPVGGPGTGLRYWDGTQWDRRTVADTWTRVWCNVLDVALASIVWIALAMVIFLPIVLLTPQPSTEGADNPAQSLLSVLTLLVAFGGYFAVSYRVWGRTPAMMLGNLWVIHIPSGAQRLAWGTAIGRTMGLLLGYACGIMTLIWLITTASSRTKQGPHDSWARTAVLRGARPLPPTQTQPSTLAPPQTTAPTPTPTPRPVDPTPPAIATTVAAPVSPPYSGATTAVVEAPRRRSRAPWIIGIVAGSLVAALVLVMAAVWIDSTIRTNTTAQLLDAVEDAEKVNLDYQRDPRWGELAGDLDTANARTGMTDEYYDEAWRTFIYGTRDNALRYVEPIQEAILDVEAVNPLPWHSDITEARDAYLEHATTWQEVIERRSKHTESEESVPGIYEDLSAEISTTWATAERRFKDLSYPWMPREFTTRINAIFADQSVS